MPLSGPFRSTRGRHRARRVRRAGRVSRRLIPLASGALALAAAAPAAPTASTAPTVTPASPRLITRSLTSGAAAEVDVPGPLGGVATYALSPLSFTAGVARWDPCTPIHYRINLAGAPRTGYRDARQAVQRIGAASGLRFVFDGTTRDLPTSTWGQGGDRTGRWPAFTIAWARPGVGPGRSDLLDGGGDLFGAGREAGSGGWHVFATSRDGGFTYSARITTGYVVLDRDVSRRLKTGFAGGPSLGALLLHEVGHAVGLGHVADPTQVMYPVLTTRKAVLGPGDLAGLRAVGTAAGCLAG